MILLIASPKNPDASPLPPVVIGESLAGGNTRGIIPRLLSEYEKELVRIGMHKVFNQNETFTFFALPVGHSLPKHVRDQVNCAIGTYVPKSNKLRKAEKKAEKSEITE